MTSVNSANRAPRFLVIRRDNIGDLVCTTPLMSALRMRYPQAWVGVLANSYNAPVLAGNPDVDAVFAYHKAKHGGISALGVAIERTRLVLALRRERLDVAIVATPAYRPRTIALAAWLGAGSVAAFVPGGAPRRGVDLPVSPDQPGTAAEAELVFRLAPALGLIGPPPALRVVADAAALARARGALDARGWPALGPVIGIHISARKPSQRWPADRFAALIRALGERHQARIVLFWAPGSQTNAQHPGDDEKAATVLHRCDGLPVLPWPTEVLGELIGGLAACDQVVLADGGAMHIAAGLGKPIVGLFGKSDRNRWRPWGVPHQLLQMPSEDVADLSVETVLEAYTTLVGATRAAPIASG